MYPNIYKQKIDGEEDTDEKKLILSAPMSDRWNAHSFVYKLVKELNMKPQEVLDEKYMETISWTAYLYDYNKEQERMYRENNK